jgi:hypothetical protein
MSEFHTASGETLRLRRMDARETKRLTHDFGRACQRECGQEMAETFDALFSYCASRAVENTPDIGELAVFLGVEPDDKAAWLRFVVLESEVESVGFVAAALALTLGINAIEVARFRADVERLGVG